MRRRVNPLDRLPVSQEEAKAKVALVLQVLSGEKSISEACRETGLKPLSYYKLEERLISGMLSAASMPAVRARRSKDPAAEANQLAAQTEVLREEHRRMQALVRMTKRLFRSRSRKPSLKPPKTGKMTPATDAEPAATEPPRRPGRPPAHSPNPS
ncbi:MAG: hypothetical protein HY716_12875 [Planctomycetes bacterium]|nr:hypothetical protein [Planctomycetota bacterium]